MRDPEIVNYDTASLGQDSLLIVTAEGQKGAAGIRCELEKMFPKTITHAGNREFVVVNSDTLRLRSK
jgi:hypothetical protein